MQGYLTQCSPATIEANVNNAASGAESVVTVRPGAFADGALLGAPGAALIQRATPPATSTQIPATPAEVATTVVSSRVEPTQPASDPDLARNRKPSEIAVTKRLLIAAQNALGIFADGNFGVPGDSKTREAIEQFQFGRNRRSPSQWPAADINGELSGRTGELLPFLSPMPVIFKTPFERAYLGNNQGALSQQLTQVAPAQLSQMLDKVKVTDFEVPANSPPDVITAKMKQLRDKLAELRRVRGIDPDKGGVLDAKLYDSLINQPL